MFDFSPELLDATPLGLPIRIAGQIFGGGESEAAPPARTSTRNNRGAFGTMGWGEAGPPSKIEADRKKEKDKEGEDGTEWDGGESGSGGSASTSTGGASEPDVTALLRELMSQLPAIRQAETQQDIQRRIVTAALRNQGLSELSSRKRELANIEAWRDLQVAREQARSNQSIALMNTAYLSMMPNANLMNAMSTAAQTAMKNFTIPDMSRSKSIFG